MLRCEVSALYAGDLVIFEGWGWLQRLNCPVSFLI
jgi:hypothetical protein